MQLRSEQALHSSPRHSCLHNHYQPAQPHCRSVPPTTPLPGRVLIDDRPVGDYDRKWLKQRVALVSQEPVLYARSIRRCARCVMLCHAMPCRAMLSHIPYAVVCPVCDAQETLCSRCCFESCTFSCLLLMHRLACPPAYLPACRNILYGLEEEDGVPPDQVPTQEDVEYAAR